METFWEAFRVALDNVVVIVYYINVHVFSSVLQINTCIQCIVHIYIDSQNVKYD